MYTTTQQPVLTDDDEQPRRRWRWLVALLLVFMIGGLVWAVRPNPHLTRAKELQKALFSPDAKNLSADQRKAMFDEYRTEMKKLTDEQKAALFEPMRQQQMADLDRYFAMSQQEKNRYLDERIDRSEKAKKDRQLKGGGAPGAAGFAGARSARRLRRRSAGWLRRSTGRQRQRWRSPVSGGDREAEEADARPDHAGGTREDGSVPPRHGQPPQATRPARDDPVTQRAGSVGDGSWNPSPTLPARCFLTDRCSLHRRCG